MSTLQGFVQFDVLAPSHYGQIFWPVVGRIAIDVVHDLVGCDVSSKHGFSNENGAKYIATDMGSGMTRRHNLNAPISSSDYNSASPRFVTWTDLLVKSPEASATLRVPISKIVSGSYAYSPAITLALPSGHPISGCVFGNDSQAPKSLAHNVNSEMACRHFSHSTYE